MHEPVRHESTRRGPGPDAPRQRRERGSALPIVLILSFLILTLGLALIGTAEVEMRLGVHHAAQVEALYIAEAGLHRALDELNRDSSWRGEEEGPAFPDGDNEIGRGKYLVTVIGPEMDPSLEEIAPYTVRITSKAVGHGPASRSVVVLARPEIEVQPILEFGVFACGNIYLRDNEDNVMRDGDVFTNGDIVLDRSDSVQNADVYARGNATLEEQGSVDGCDVHANGNIQCSSSASPNIEGSAYAGGNPADSSKVSGSSEGFVDPLPVPDLCSQLDDEEFAITTARIADWRSRADKTIYDNVILPEDQDELGDPITGIIHITGNLLVDGNTTYRGDAILVVDGNILVRKELTREDPDSEDILILVTEGSIEVENSGTLDVDAFFYTTGNFYVKDGGLARIVGGVIAFGNVDSQAGRMDITYTPPTNPEVLLEGSYAMLSWKELKS